MDILLLRYNNYFNRKVMKEDSFDGYMRAADKWLRLTEINFKPMDSVNTTQIVNMDADWTPDYLVTEDLTRWFVIECRLIRKGQYELTLRRDVLADFDYAYKSAPALVERGPLDVESPYVYNKENFSFNQIKRSEKLIKDPTGTAWIVGYVSTDTDFDGYMESPAEGEEMVPTFDDLGLVLNDGTNPLLGATAKSINKCQIRAKIADGPSSSIISLVMVNWDGSATWIGTQSFPPAPINSYINFSFSGNASEARKQRDIYGENMSTVFKIRKQYVYEGLEDWAGISTDAIGMERLKTMVGQQVLDPKTSKVYTITNVASSIDDNGVTQLTAGDNAKLYNELAYDLQTAAQGTKYSYYDNNPIAVELDANVLSISLVETDYKGQRRTKFSNLRRRLLDAPYDMFCMPFDAKNMALAQSFVTTATDGKTKKIYDIQILPYCPNAQYVNSGVAGMTQGTDYDLIEEYDGSNWNLVSYLLWNSKSSGTIFNDTRLDAFKFENIKGLTLTQTERRKVANECCSWRLTSPNYNGTWEFNVAKNGGSVEGFRIDYTYRPYSPYIHVAPLFKGLYGDVNDDARGLICNGDFSIDLVSDAWTEYQLNNKNYQNIFATQIRTMDANHGIDLASGAVSSALGAVGSGLGVGALTGNLAAGIGTGVASAMGGAIDVGLSEIKYRNNRQQAIDLHNYQLGNVKALPDTLTKVSSYNVNNKYFPFIEEYACTEEEVKAFVGYLRERNYKIGVVSTIDAVLENGYNDYEYVKATVLRLPTIKDDFHLASTIAEELETGAYM